MIRLLTEVALVALALPARAQTRPVTIDCILELKAVGAGLVLPDPLTRILDRVTRHTLGAARPTTQ